MAEKILVSIIVPIYNTELYVERCIKSIENQSRKDFEVIFVNDGSMDKSMEILEKRTESFDFKYTIINQKNSGVSKARNEGLKVAKGNYVLFLDSDDYIHKELIERLCEEDKQEVVFWKFNKMEESTGRCIKEVNKKIKGTEFSSTEMFDAIINGDMWVWICAAAFKKEFLQKWNITFPEGYKYGEDLFFIFKSLVLAETISFNEKSLTFYSIRDQSATQTVTTKKFDSVEALFSLINEMNRSQINKKVEEILQKVILPANFLNVFHELTVRKCEKKLMLDYLNSNKNVLHFLHHCKRSDIRDFKDFIKLKLFINFPILSMRVINFKERKFNG